MLPRKAAPETSIATWVSAGKGISVWPGSSRCQTRSPDELSSTTIRPPQKKKQKVKSRIRFADPRGSRTATGPLHETSARGAWARVSSVPARRASTARRHPGEADHGCSFRRVRAVLGINRDDNLGLLKKGKAIHKSISDHPEIFVDPHPPLVTVLGKVVGFEDAQQVAETRVKGSAAIRDVKAAELVTVLETVRAYVQALADASPEQAEAIIESASMTVADVSGYKKPLLEAKQDVPSGPVRVRVNVGELTADASGKVFFEWQSTSDGGLTWSTAVPTSYGHMDFEGLTPLHTYGVRVRFSDLKGAHAWSQTLTFVVR